MKVSVICLVYNHEKYLRKCLEGFVSQVCDFEYEVLIHDDASTDSSASIIKEFEEKYPNIIMPIYQKENQYSKGVKISKTYLYPKAQGEYLAWCEGDDCWTDPLKLQKQVDFLDNNPDFSTCVHRVTFNNLKTERKTIIPKETKNKEYTLDEIIRGGALFQLSALMIRKELLLSKPDCFEAKGFGDIQVYIYGAICGRFMLLSDIMSQYNHGVEGSWTERTKYDINKRIEHAEERKRMLEAVNEYYQFKYSKSFEYSIDLANYEIACLKEDKEELKKEKYKKFIKREKANKIKKFIKKIFLWIAKIFKK